MAQLMHKNTAVTSSKITHSKAAKNKGKRPQDKGKIMDLSSQEICQNSQDCSNEEASDPSNQLRCKANVDKVSETTKDTEHTDASTNSNVAQVNANTNGMVVSACKQMETDSAVETKKCVGQVNKDKISLETLGLSLSLSGIQLYVKVDSEETNQLLASRNVHLSAQTRKDGPRTQTITSNSGTQTDFPSEDSKSVSYMQEATNNNPQNSAFCVRQSRRNEIDTKSQTMQISLANRVSTSVEFTPLTANTSNGFQDNDPQSCHQVLPSEGITKLRKGKIVKLNKRFEADEMDISNNKDYIMIDYQDEMLYYRQDETNNYRQDDLRNYRQASPRSVPVKYVAFQQKDSLKRHIDDQTERNILGKRSKQEYIEESSNNRSHYNAQVNDNYLQIDEDNYETGQEAQEYSGVQIIKALNKKYSGHSNDPGPSRTSHDPGPSRTSHDPGPSRTSHNKSHCANDGVVQEVLDIMSLSKLNESTSIITMDTFLEYTKTVRKIMKNDFKALNDLFKEFSVVLQERDRNNLSQSESNEAKIELNNFRCSLM